MKKKTAPKATHLEMMIPGLQLSAQEKKELEAAMEGLNRQAQMLGLLEPLDAEPSLIFFPEER
jgi:hypothetical protein